MRGAVAIFRRDFKKFLGNPAIIVMTLFMPIMYLIIFGNAMGGTITHIPIGVAQEVPFENETHLYLSAVDGLGHFHSGDNPPMFDVTVYSGEETAKAAFADGKVMAVAIFPSGVSTDRPVRLYLDSSEYMIPDLIQSGVSSVIAQSGANNSLQVSKIYGDIKYIQFFGVGVIVMAIFMTTMMGGGISMIRDRENGIIEGYLVTPVKRSSIIFGIIASGTVKAFMAGFIIFMVDIFVAGVVVDSIETFLMVLVVLFIISIGITSLVISFSSRFSTQQEYASVVAFLNLILFMTSGAFYPVLGMPDWLSWIAAINPEYYAIHALRSLILRGQVNLIGLDLLALIVFSGIAIALGITTYRRTLE
ncbi:MAG: ABC transporter permease [Methanofollis sp.]|uniref:ABC transporter permease n=1 Tax=Methanofollis sp. TaxID=2052835 RepID=UPI002601BFD2|nr:ABC transporter permease [Methanofollis sp.]MDD4255075.1 ABC transporter permease [Methanofollis sp.]